MLWLDAKDLFLRLHGYAPSLAEAAAHYDLPTRIWHQAGEDAQATVQLLAACAANSRNAADSGRTCRWPAAGWAPTGMTMTCR